MLSAGHVIVRTLEAHGVERVYAVPGESYLDVLDGLYESAIKTVVCRQEGGAGLMALSEGRLTGIPGVAMVTRGPGAANAMIAIHTAWQDATAMLLFVGLIPIPDRDRDAFQEFSLNGWFGTTAKRVMTIDNAERAGDMIAEAFRIASSGRPGPVVIGLPEDLITEKTQALPASPITLPFPEPANSSMQELISRLAFAERPAFVVGGDGWHQGCGRTLGDFATAAGIPIFSEWRAYDAVPQQTPAWSGWLGYDRSDAVAAGFNAADLLVFIGCGRADALSDGYTLGMDTQTVLVLADPEATMHAGRIDQHIVTTPSLFAQALSGHDPNEARGQRDDSWMQDRAQIQKRVAAHRANTTLPDAIDTAGVDLGAVFGELDTRLDGKAILTYGAGNATIWGHRFIRHHVPASLVGARNGAMGLSVPAAVVGAMIFPERRVVAICGDGDFFMNGQEIATAVAQEAKPLVIVIDNGVYGTIVSHQEKQYPGRPSGTAMVNPDFAAWMRAFGGFGEVVWSTEEFAPALERALQMQVPALLHLHVSPEVMPPATDEIAVDQDLS